jgi:hypothetical protein
VEARDYRTPAGSGFTGTAAPCPCSAPSGACRLPEALRPLQGGGMIGKVMLEI